MSKLPSGRELVHSLQDQSASSTVASKLGTLQHRHYIKNNIGAMKNQDRTLSFGSSPVECKKEVNQPSMLSSLQGLEDFVGKQLSWKEIWFSRLLLFFYVNIFLHTKVENSVSKQGSESKVEGMVSLLLLGETGHFGATKISEEYLITQGIT